jgi:hypothetical protein
MPPKELDDLAASSNGAVPSLKQGETLLLRTYLARASDLAS